MWDRWQKGDSLEKIAQFFDRGHGSVARILESDAIVGVSMGRCVEIVLGNRFVDNGLQRGESVAVFRVNAD